MWATILCHHKRCRRLKSIQSPEQYVLLLVQRFFAHKRSQLIWSVLFLYPEYSQSDFIERFSELGTFEAQLAEMFPPHSAAVPWDRRGDYRADTIQIYFLANSTSALNTSSSSSSSLRKRWIKVANHITLQKALSHPEHVIPGLPVFHVLVPGEFRNNYLKESEEV